MENHVALLRKAIDKYKPLAVSLSDDLAKNPELSGKEFQSSKKIVNILTEAGFTVEYPYAGLETAFKAVIDNGDGPSVAVMIEYDALPGIGHGCGHNLHGSMSVLTGLALADLRSLFRGKLFLIGTPAEEGDGAKVKMASDGLFDDMDMAMMIHCFAGVTAPAMRCLSLKCYNFTFKGQTAHAAACPWDGRNALTAARKFLDLLDARRDSYMSDTRVSSIIKDGGKAPNVIPDTAVAQVEFRAETAARLKKVEDIVLKCAKGASIALDCEMSWEYDFPEGFFDLMPNSAIEGAVCEMYDDLGIRYETQLPPSGSTDAGNVSYHCPVSHPILSISDEPLTLHSVAFAEATQKPLAYTRLAEGAEILARLALRTWNDADFRNAAKADFEKHKAAYLAQ